MESPLHHEIHRCTNKQASWVLMVHGAGGSTRTWRKQVEEFGKHYHLLIIDLPGHAGSAVFTKDRDSYDFEWISSQIWDVVDRYTSKPIHLVAVSLGSIIGMQMYQLRPNGIAALLFAGPIVSLNVSSACWLVQDYLLPELLAFAISTASWPKLCCQERTIKSRVKYSFVNLNF
jgi:pimeloyl-ACP methyl ester carboxylesterase